MSTSTVDFDQKLRARHRTSRIFNIVCQIATWSGIVVLAVLLVSILITAWGSLSWDFITNHMSRRPSRAGVIAGIWGSLWLMMFTAMFSIPIGVGAAVYLEEYASDNLFTRIVRLNISNLAGVPSIVFGMLGLTVFVRVIGAGESVLAGAMTLTLLILPVVIIACQEALRSVPQSIRHGALALGATKWQSIRTQVLPAAIPGIMTGVILSLSRAIGETAPLVVVGASTYIGFAPGKFDSLTGEGGLLSNPLMIKDMPFDYYTVIPMQIYYWVSLAPKTEFRYLAAAAIVILLVILLVMNALAVYLRHRFQKKLNW